jgi:site-specific recombinase XerD
MTIKQYLQKKYSKSTLKGNLYNIKRFTDYYGNRAERAVYKDVLNYIGHLRKDHDLHPKTLRHCLYAAKIYFDYLLETGKRNDHPCSELFLKDKINKQIQVDNLYSSETLERFYESHQIKKKTYLLNRNKIIISLLIYQALTVNEIAELEVQDIDLDKGEIHIKGNPETTTKSPKSRTLPLQAKQILLVHNYLKNDREKLLRSNADPGEKRFVLGQYGEAVQPHGISRIINENRPKSERIQPIKIRQSVIANLLKKENDARVVQVFAGHKRASTTVGYRQTELEMLRQAVNAFHPLR